MRVRDWQRRDLTAHPQGDRRHSPRGRVGEPERVQIVPLILGTFQEMLGVPLSLDEAARMFGLQEMTCRVILDDLVERNRLRRTRDGRYAMA